MKSEGGFGGTARESGRGEQNEAGNWRWSKCTIYIMKCHNETYHFVQLLNPNKNLKRLWGCCLGGASL